MHPHAKKLVKILSVSTAMALLSPSAGAEQVSDDFSLLADDIQYNSTGTSVTAKGNVNILSDKGNLWADDLTYNTDTGKLVAKGNIIYVDENDMTVFLKEIELNDEFKAVILRDLQVKIGNEEKDGPKLAAKEASKTSDNVLTLKGAVYSPCKGCADDDDDLPWKIRAEKIEYDKENGTATYDNAMLDVYGVPVFYLPYFKHSLDNKPLDGLLTPRFGNSTNRGFEFKTGYYKRFSPNQDMTTRFRYMSERGIMLGAEHRYNSKNLYSDIKGSAIEDENTGTWRSHLETEIEYVSKAGRRFGANINLASDDTYLDEFFERNPSHLASTIYAEDTSKNHYYAATATFYQDQTATGDDDKTAQVLPKFIVERSFNFGHNKTNNLTISANVLSLSRSEGTNSQRLVTEAEYSDTVVRDSGDKFNFAAGIRGDLYNVETDAFSTGGSKGTHGRILPQVSLQWERPFISESMTHKITPKAMLIAAPRGGNPSEIPNEDSVAYELDTSNLFDTNRFAGYDRIESGTRFVYGMDNEWGTPGRTKWRSFIGQSYRLFDDEDLPTTGGTETNASDWVGAFSGTPYNWLTFDSKFRLDNATLEARRFDNSALLGDRDNTYLHLTHSQLDAGPEEVKVTGRYRFNERYDFAGEVHKDLTGDGRFLNTEGQITYTGQCYRMSFKARRRGFENRSVPPSTDYLFNIELLTLGRDYD